MKKARKKLVGGGAYRAFVRQSTFGVTGTPNLAAVAREYRRLKAGGELPPEVQTLGQAARQVALLPSQARSRGSHFGPNFRQLQRQKLQSSLLAFHQRHSLSSPWDLAQTVVKEAQGGRALKQALSMLKFFQKKTSSTG